MSLALFDLDNTLIRGDSAQAWARFLVERGVVADPEFLPRNRVFMEEYEQGRLDLAEYFRHNLGAFIGGPRSATDSLAREYLATVLEPMILAKGEALIREHRARGDEVVIISATVEFLVGPIAKRLQADHVIAVRLEEVDAKLTGNILGVPSFREGKLTRILEWLEAESDRLADAVFYSDSQNDLPLLEAVGRPVAVDPDAVLERTARERGWEVLSLRED